MPSKPAVPVCSARHTPCPQGYNQWHAWAESKSKTHRQIRCPECGLWAVWVPKQNRKSKAEARHA